MCEAQQDDDEGEMMKKWCYNAKTGEIFSYNIEGNLTDFPRGVLLAYGDYLTTGLENREAAELLQSPNPPAE